MRVQHGFLIGFALARALAHFTKLPVVGAK